MQHGNKIMQSIDQLISDAPTMKFVFVGDAGTGRHHYLNNTLTKSSLLLLNQQ